MTPRGPSSWLFGVDHLLRMRRDQLAFYADMRARHGDVVPLRIGPYRSWLLFHPREIEAVLATKARSFVRFERLMRVLRQWNGDSMLVAEGETWRQRRRRVLPALATRRLAGYAAIVSEEAERWSAKLAERADANGALALDADDVFAQITLDVALRVFFGKTPDESGAAMAQSIAAISEIAFRESTTLFPPLPASPAARRKRAVIQTMRAFVGGLVEEGLARPSGDDLLSILIETHGRDPGPIAEDAMSLLIAGHETSGAALAWLFLALATHPDARAAIEAELDAAPARGAAFDQWPRLSAAIAETLGLHPPAYALFTRQAVDDVGMAGFVIRKGELAQIVPFTTGRDPRFFAEPEAFRPERHMGPAAWPPYAYLPFGAGPRSCIGQSFGLMETTLIAAALLRRFTPEAPTSRPKPQARFSLRPAGGLPMIWRRRGALNGTP